MSVYDKAKKRREQAPEWKKQLVKELLKPKKKHFPRRKVYSLGIDRVWTADLMFMQKFARQNKGFNYILVVLDVFSRYAYARPLKNKTGAQVAGAFEDIFKESKPKKLWTDRGTDFYNKQMKNLLAQNGITHYSTFNEPKAMIAERFIRTLRKKIETNYIYPYR